MSVLSLDVFSNVGSKLGNLTGNLMCNVLTMGCDGNMFSRVTKHFKM